MRFHIETLGCKVNQYEAQALGALLRARGHVSASGGEPCDVCVVNTCAVTGEASRKSRQAVRRLQKSFPGALVAVAGCLSQIAPEEIAALGADLVAGSGDRRGFIDALERLFAGEQASAEPDDPFSRRVFEPLPADGGERTRAMLKIQDGCDNFCAYCVIPYARGRVRSLPPESAAAEAKRLASEGFRELVVTGIEISSYGKDLGDTTLVDVLRAVSAAADGARLRLGSLEPGSVTPAFCAALAAIPDLCGHFHLSLQSGCDETLRRMRRSYGAAAFFEAVTSLRRHFPDCGVTADLITGFPGETDAEFEETLAFVEKCAFSDMHVFPFSPRPGTSAADMPGQIEKQVKRARAARVRGLARTMKNAFIDSRRGRVLDVLFEREEDGVSTGHAGNYLEISVPGTGLRGELLSVRLTGRRGGGIFGELADVRNV
ncbi:MAG: tRNA (N(6)-L-threonylcarbamoyladenosine(37)-C(2))-methylthiotransferase MtaB [Oscillospiraceae bacterium]|jgi:threonylcarbamoyladenosine tRNA methylthiotransferase MtaB|nr:tRNA (N(6)-L-threonylcarbamoyladenosine(37)-C(2))-methylthiotransferase MtaB [Oscillospiraceae bacterium]